MAAECGAKLTCLLGAALLLRRALKSSPRAAALNAEAVTLCWHLAKFPALRTEAELLARVGVSCVGKGAPAGSC